MLYEVITDHGFRVAIAVRERLDGLGDAVEPGNVVAPSADGVITSYSIHYTKLYELHAQAIDG